MIKYLLLFSLVILSACEPVDEKTKTMQTPESVALGFFEAIYTERDAKKAEMYVTPELQKILQSYHIASAVQRHVLGLSMTNVEFSIAEIDIDFFRKFTDEVNVIVKMKGLKGGKHWIDDRTLRIVKNKSKKTWVIVEIVQEK